MWGEFILIGSRVHDQPHCLKLDSKAADPDLYRLYVLFQLNEVFFGSLAEFLGGKGSYWHRGFPEAYSSEADSAGRRWPKAEGAWGWRAIATQCLGSSLH